VSLPVVMLIFVAVAALMSVVFEAIASRRR
jgi:hypothetical protein